MCTRCGRTWVTAGVEAAVERGAVREKGEGAVRQGERREEDLDCERSVLERAPQPRIRSTDHARCTWRVQNTHRLWGIICALLDTVAAIPAEIDRWWTSSSWFSDRSWYGDFDDLVFDRFQSILLHGFRSKLFSYPNPCKLDPFQFFFLYKTNRVQDSS